MAKLSIEDIDLTGKRVVMRVDFNCPIRDGAVANPQRIDAALPTIELALAKGAAGVVLLSHLGRPEGRARDEFSLAPVAAYLTKTLGAEKFSFVAGDCVSAEAAAACAALAGGRVVLLENVRFHAEEEGKGLDAAGNKVKPSKDEVAAFAAKLSALGDVYVNDAFGAAHRAHASIAGISLEPRVAGLLMKRELDFFARALDEPARPFVAIIGGAKVSDKIQLIENLLDKVNAIVIGGGMGYTFKKVAEGVSIGSSLFDEEGAKIVPQILAKAKERGVDVHLPFDHTCGDSFSAGAATRVVSDAEGVPDGWMGLDIGPETAAKFAGVVRGAKTVIWNGPMGVFEWDSFVAGTKAVMDAAVAATEAGSLVIIGGGDTATASLKFGTVDKVSHVSTGGGASLELLEGKVLPGVAHLSEKK
jgi:phosphoglycerate kinase